jgi:excisionase family DNA binding protein
MKAAIKLDSNATSQVVKLLHTKAEAAAMLSVSLRTVDTLISLKELPVRRIRRRVLIPHTALMNFIRNDHLAEPEAA